MAGTHQYAKYYGIWRLLHLVSSNVFLKASIIQCKYIKYEIIMTFIVLYGRSTTTWNPAPKTFNGGPWYVMLNFTNLQHFVSDVRVLSRALQIKLTWIMTCTNIPHCHLLWLWIGYGDGATWWRRLTSFVRTDRFAHAQDSQLSKQREFATNFLVFASGHVSRGLHLQNIVVWCRRKGATMSLNP